MTRFYCGTAEVTRLRPSVISGRWVCGWRPGRRRDRAPTGPLSSLLLAAVIPSSPPPGLAGSSFSRSILPSSGVGSVKWAKLITYTVPAPLEPEAEDRVFCALRIISDTQRGLERSIINTLVPLPNLGNKTLQTLIKAPHTPLWSHSPPSTRKAPPEVGTIFAVHVFIALLHTCTRTPNRMETFFVRL